MEETSSPLDLKKGLCAWKLFWLSLAVNLTLLQNDMTLNLLQGLFHPRNHLPSKNNKLIQFFQVIQTLDWALGKRTQGITI